MQKYSVHFLTALILALICTKCHSVSEEIDKSFKKVNNSLIESNKLNDDRINMLYASIDSNRHINEALAAKADQIFAATVAANQYMDSLREALNQLDTTGENTEIPARLLLHSPVSDSLNSRLLTVYHSNYSLYSDDAPKAHIDSIFGHLKREKWQQEYFDRTPTVAAMTILSKLQNDCMYAARFTLKEIKEKLR